jgi:hypothetical protein
MLDGPTGWQILTSSVLRRAPFQASRSQPIEATWRSGDAADCKSVNAGSIPAVASSAQQTWYRLVRTGVRLPRAAPSRCAPLPFIR